MADDAHEERFRQHEEMLRSLAAMLVHLDGYLATQGLMNERLTTAIECLTTTQAPREMSTAQGRTTTPETDQQRHLRLHAALTELLAEYPDVAWSRAQGTRLEGDNVLQILERISARELLEWSYHQTQEPPAARE